MRYADRLVGAVSYVQYRCLVVSSAPGKDGGLRADAAGYFIVNEYHRPFPVLEEFQGVQAFLGHTVFLDEQVVDGFWPCMAYVSSALS